MTRAEIIYFLTYSLIATNVTSGADVCHIRCPRGWRFQGKRSLAAVSLIGTVMLTALGAGLVEGVAASSVIPAEAKQPLVEVAEKGVQLMSNTQLQTGLQEAGVSEAGTTELNAIYGSSRTGAFKAGVSLLIYASLLALVISLWLPKRKLVEATE